MRDIRWRDENDLEIQNKEFIVLAVPVNNPILDIAGPDDLIEQVAEPHISNTQ
jgi:hypothetical protein